MQMLSRVPTIPSTCAGTVTVPELTLEDVAQEQGKDEVLNDVRRLVSSGLSNQTQHWNHHPIGEGENCTNNSLIIATLRPSRPTMTS